jgi:hypothetical protein
MSTYAEIINQLFEQMSENGYFQEDTPSIDMGSILASGTELDDLQHFLNDVLVRRFGEPGEPE